MNKFYVYALLDPTKPGKYKFPKTPLLPYEPFYIGKGQTYRCLAHVSEKLETTANPFKVNKINKILRQNKTPIIFKIFKNLSNSHALKLEKKLIKIIGRRNLGRGCLTNLTDGGEGMIGYKHTLEARKLIALSNHCRGMSEETKKKISVSVRVRGSCWTEKMRRAQSERIKKTSFYDAHFSRPGSRNGMFGKKIGLSQRRLLSNLARKKTGRKNPNNKYCYCLFNPKYKKFYHKIYNPRKLIRGNLNTLKTMRLRRFNGWILVRALKGTFTKCPCKTILKNNISMDQIPMGRTGRINYYIK